MAKIASVIECNKRYPEKARAAKQQGVVVVSFRVDRRGTLIASAVKSSSSHPLLDEEAHSRSRSHFRHRRPMWMVRKSISLSLSAST